MEKFTAESVKNFDSDVDYTTVLNNFEGPLDLLLHLINQDQIEIKDIFVSEVTEQFLAYMKGLPYIDMDKASEYLNIAATILDIKARSLLPPIEDDYGDEYYDDTEDPKSELIRKIEEYKMIKEEADKLKELETIGYYFKEPDKEFEKVHVTYKDFTFDKLVQAFAKFMLKQGSNKETQTSPVRQIPKDPFTVADRVKIIRTKIKEKGCVSFEKLFDESSTRAEIVTTFQALLELLKHQFLRVRQDDVFSEIVIEYNPEKSEEEFIGEIDEYN